MHRHKPARTGPESRPSILEGRYEEVTLETGGNAGGFVRWCGRRDSNSHTLRRQNLNLVCLPISPRPRGFKLKTKTPGFWPGVLEYGVDDGNRTHDTRSHNPVLYQLSYAHHIALLTQIA
ncbi:conserved protein of unknown function [Ectopseudomonas oleovorans]|uniref:Uncharacterized protein n=1 Tax=Ectopseudomonas oleovorans TaxID=301 RepID=A0A653BAV1_ECTOL|nr:conserved protein of unknown function [Pseudomonas oleovorans]